METGLDKIRGIIAGLQNRLEWDQSEPTWQLASDVTDDLVNYTGDSFYECSFGVGGKNKIQIGSRGIAALQWDTLVFVYTGTEVPNLYWSIHTKVSGSAELDAIRADLDALL